MRAPHILLAAYQCAPGQGSVSQIGWEWYRRLRERGPVTLVTHIRNKVHLEEAGMTPRDDIRYIDTEWFAAPLYRLASWLFRSSEHARFLLASLDFYLYDWLAYRALRHDPIRSQWKLAHAVTPVTTAAPTHLHRLGLPLVLGPLNCGMGTPTQFPEILRGDATWLYPLRNVARVIDRVVGSRRKAARFLSATCATDRQLGKGVADRVRTMLENGVDLSRFRATDWPMAPSASQPLRVLFVGRLIPCKGVSLLLEAVACQAGMRPVEVRIVGDGPMRDAWERHTAALGLDRQVRFLGAQSLVQINRHLAWAHALCLPSVRESGGGVLIEAMAAARPVIAVNYGGPAEIVDDAVGRLLDATDTRSVVRDLTRCLEDICMNPTAWARRGAEGLARARSLYGWDAKVDAAAEMYQEIIDEKTASLPEPAGSDQSDRVWPTLRLSA